RTVGVPPDPEDLAAVDGRLHRVLPKNLPVEERLPERRPQAEHNTVAIDPLSRDAIEPLGYIEAFDLHRRLPAGDRVETHTAVAEAIHRIFVAVAGDVKENFLPQEARLVESDDTV